MSQSTPSDASTSGPPPGGRRRRVLPGLPSVRRVSRGGIALAAAVAMSAAGASTALATTAVIAPPATPAFLKATGPVNSEYGFPAWYQDSKDQRVELCLDGNDPMCGFVAAPVAGFDNTAPTVFPTNFPDEAFYASASSTLTLPNGGKATLGLGLEAAFLNAVQNGDQITFARQRIFVVGGPPNTTLHFHEPYRDIDVDTDATGKGRITEDIAPSVGNFDGALKGAVNPFLTWDTGPVITASGTYLGDPAIAHKIAAGPNGAEFSVKYTDAGAPPTAVQTAVQTDFTVLGKIATNTGVKADAAIQTTDLSGKPVIDVFATSEADAGELYVAGDSAIATTPMEASAKGKASKSFYARVAFTGTAPATVTVKNVGDAPTSSSQVPVTKGSPVAVTSAVFDGKTLHVAASGPGTLVVLGYDPKVATLASGVVDITTGAPPATVTVTNGTDKASAPVQITGGGVTTPGEPPVPAGPVVAPVCTIFDPNTGAETPGPCPVGGPVAGTPSTVTVAPAAATALGDSVVLDASATTNATSYEWTAVSGVAPAGGPVVTITNGTTAKPTVKLTPYDVSKYTSATLPKTAQNAPAVVQVVAVTGTGASATRSTPVKVEIPVKLDTLGPLTTKYTAGKEYRIDGTSTITGGSLVLNPPTSVSIYNTSTGKFVGTAQVDTTGAWSFRPKSLTGVELARNITVVTSRGAYTTGLVAGAPNV